MTTSPWYFITPTDPVHLARVSARLAYCVEQLNTYKGTAPDELYEATFAVQDALNKLGAGQVLVLETSDPVVGEALSMLLQ